MRALVSFLVAALVFSVALPSLAAADDSVFVLGIRSVQGDDELSRNLTGAIRQEARGVRGWSVSDAEVTLDQMSLAHGCDEPDPTCLANIAEALSADRIIYGTVNRAGGESNYNFALSLYIFEASSGRIAESLTDTIPRIATDIDDLRPRATNYVAELSGQEQFGSIRIEADAPGAIVRLDGEEVGVLDDDGTFVINDVSAGERLIEIESEDHPVFRTATQVEPDTQGLVRATLTGGEVPGGGGDGPNLSWLPGVGLMVAGGVFLALTAVTWGKIGALNEDNTDNATWFAFRRNPLVSDLEDVCTSDMISDELKQDYCERADTLELNQYIFLGVGVAAVAAGIALYVLLTGDDDDDADQARVQVSPTFGRRSGGGQLRLTF